MIDFSTVTPGTYKRLGEDSCLLLAKNTDGTLAFIIELPKSTKFMAKNLKLNGITISEVQLEDFSRVILSLKNPNDERIFVRLCEDLESVDNSGSIQEIADNISSRLEQWVYFLARARGTTIPLRTQIGLIGELDFIRTLLEAGCKTETVLEWWLGPDGNAKDFVLPKISYEVKSVLTDDETVTISNKDQLDISDGKPLILSVYEMEESSKGKNVIETARELVSRYFNNDKNLKAIFERKLLSLNMNIMEKYENLHRFETVGITYYAVTEDFPKLTSAHMPSGITDVKYKISLDAIAEHTTKFDKSIITKEV